MTLFTPAPARRQHRPLVALTLAVAGLIAAVSPASAAGYVAQKVSLPGAGFSMSSAGYLTGTFQVKCSKLGGQPNYTICYYAPFYWDGKSSHKVSWSGTTNYVYSIGINDSMTLVGNELYGQGGWVWSNGKTTYTGSLPNGYGSTMSAINNPGVAIGSARDSAYVNRAVTFANGTLSEVGAFPAGVAYTGADINDAGVVVGTVTAADGTSHGYAYAGGTTIQVPDLAGATNCSAVRVSQQNGWVVGSCWSSGSANRPFRFNYLTGQQVELSTLPGAAGGATVNSVNSSGTAVGTTDTGAAVAWPAGSAVPTALGQYLPAGTVLSRAYDINDAGTILAIGYDASWSFTTYLLRAN
jgi:probable HAF family extracellular repeat protein